MSLLLDLLCKTAPACLYDVYLTVRHVAYQPLGADGRRRDFRVVVSDDERKLYDDEPKLYIECKDRPSDGSERWLKEALSEAINWLSIAPDSVGFVFSPSSALDGFKVLTARARLPSEQTLDERVADDRLAREALQRLRKTGLAISIDVVARLYFGSVQSGDLGRTSSAICQRLKGALNIKEDQDASKVYHKVVDIARGWHPDGFDREGLFKELRRRKCDIRAFARSSTRKNVPRKLLWSMYASLAMLILIAVSYAPAFLRERQGSAFLDEANGLRADRYDRQLALTAAALRVDPGLFERALPIIQADHHFLRRFPGTYDVGIISSSGRYVAGVESDGNRIRRLRIFDLVNDTEQSVDVKRQGPARACALSDDKIIVAWQSGFVAVFSLEAAREVKTRALNNVRLVSCSKNGIALVSDDGRIRLTDEYLQDRFVGAYAAQYPRAAVTSPDGHFLVVSFFKTLITIDLKTGRLVALRRDNHDFGVLEVGRESIVVKQDLFGETLTRYTLPKLRFVSSQPSKTYNTDAIFSTLAGSGEIGDGELYAPGAIDPIAVVGGNSRGLTWSSDEKHFVSQTPEGLVVSDIDDVDPLFLGEIVPKNLGTHYAFCPNGLLIAAGFDRTIEEVLLPKVAFDPVVDEIDTDPISSLACGGRSPTVATISNHGRRLTIWYLGARTNAEPKRFNVTVPILTAVVDAADEVIAMHTNGQVEQFDKSGKQSTLAAVNYRDDALSQDRSHVAILDLSPAGRYAWINAVYEGKQYVFDLKTKASYAASGISDPLVGFSGDDARYATSEVGGISIWESHSGRLVGKLDIPLGFGALDSAGHTFMSRSSSSSGASMLRMWSVDRRSPVGAPFGALGFQYSVPLISPDGEFAASSPSGISSAMNAPAFVWAIGAASIADLNCRRVWDVEHEQGVPDKTCHRRL